MPALSFDDFVALLRCPECAGGFTFLPSPQPPEVPGEFGVLRCACFNYPVVSSVPILKKQPVTVNSISDARVVTSGPRPEALVELVAEGQGLEALLRLVAFPVCPWPLNRTRLGRALSEGEPLRSVGLTLRRRTLRRRLRAGADALTAEDWFDIFYWRSPAIFDPFSYFFYRFGQPRHVAALSLLSALPPSGKPVMDLACGYGHLLHHLTTGAAPHRAVGFDQNFHQAWVAKHWIAPNAQFVCGDGELPLPFADGALAASLCTDALHHFDRKRACLDELRRCTAGGTLVLAGVGNRLVEPLEGDEHTPAEYAALLGPWPHRRCSEAALIARYLRGKGPDLSALPRDESPTRAEKWLYFVATQDASLLRAHGPFGAWPHATGRLALNPLYDQRWQGDRLELSLRFPSPWYAFENGHMADYLPQAVTLDARDLEDVARNRRSPRVDALLAEFVVVGLPPRYARPSSRRRTVAANRALTFLLRGFIRGYRNTAHGYRQVLTAADS